MCLEILVNHGDVFALSGQWQERKVIETRELELIIVISSVNLLLEYKDEGG